MFKQTPETYRDNHLAKLKNTHRGCQIELIPGYEVDGKLQYAHLCWKKNGRYYGWFFDYGQCDHHVPQDHIFNEALERVAPNTARELWLKHYDDCSPHAAFSGGGWRWWSGRGVPSAFIEDTLTLLRERYALAQKLYESWPIDLDDFEYFGIPAEDPTVFQARKDLEQQSDERIRRELALKNTHRRKPRFKDPPETEEQRRVRKLWVIPDRHYSGGDMITCPFCGLAYVQTATERASHRRHHKQFASSLPPALDNRISALCLEPGADLVVKRGDAPWLHKLVFERARRLKQEQGYDFTQWSPDGPNWERSKYEPEPPIAYLLIEQGNIAAGVAGFVFMHWDDRVSSWHLLFVWVAPEWRRQGVLTRRWANWRKLYGDFTVETPVSIEMATFLAKANHPYPFAGGKHTSWRDYLTNERQRIPALSPHYND